MNWWKDYRKDIAGCVAYDHGAALKHVLCQQCLWALLQYRVVSSIYSGALPRWMRRTLLIVCVVWQKLIEVLRNGMVAA